MREKNHHTASAVCIFSERPSRKEMLAISATQYEALGKKSLRDYVGRLTASLLNKDFQAARRVGFPTDISAAQLDLFVSESISVGGRLGFNRESEVTPFVFLSFLRQCKEFDGGLLVWIDVCLNSVDDSPDNRMDALFALLPEDKRILVFGFK